MPRQRQVRRAVALALVTMSAVLTVPAVAAAAPSYTIQVGQWKNFVSGSQSGLFADTVGCQKFSPTDANLSLRLPFPLTFYGTRYRSATICTNGTVQFGPGAGSASGANETLPSDALGDRGFVAPFWDDFAASSGTQVIYKTVGVTPPRRFVVEWRVNRGGTLGDFFRFNVIFLENSAKIRTQYRGNAAGFDGTSATVGIQQSPLGPATQSGGSVSDGLQLTFVPTS